MRPLNGEGAPARTTAGDRAMIRVGLLARRIVTFGQSLENRRLPRFSAIATTFLAATALYGTALGGHALPLVDTLAVPAGMTIADVEVSGNSETSQIDILQTVYMTGAQTVPGLDAGAARAAIEEMPWIKSATITKLYPDRISVVVEEKAPYAVWQHDGEVVVIDRDGVPIVPYATTRFTNLPLVVGVGADRAASELIDRIEVVPELTPRVRAYIRVAERRWNLRLDNGVTVLLPEVDPIDAAAEVVRVDRETGLLGRDIKTVDMRVSDRMVIQLTPEAKERRDAALKARDKMLKQAAQREKPV